jgi:uncharacterized coiled-coil DUF342 family protein
MFPVARGTIADRDAAISGLLLHSTRQDENISALRAANDNLTEQMQEMRAEIDELKAQKP